MQKRIEVLFSENLVFHRNVDNSLRGRDDIDDVVRQSKQRNGRSRFQTMRDTAGGAWIRAVMQHTLDVTVPPEQLEQQHRHLDLGQASRKLSGLLRHRGELLVSYWTPAIFIKACT